MFPRPIFNSPFQTFAANLQPFNTGVGFGGMIPLQPQMSALGVTPSINPLLNPLLNPLAASLLAINNPVLWPNLTPQPGIGIGAFGGLAPQQAYGGGFGVNPYQVGIGAFGGFAPQQAYGGGYGGGFGVNPYPVGPALGIPQTPFSTAYGAGLSLAVNPLTSSHFAAGIPPINPAYLPYPTQPLGTLGVPGIPPTTGMASPFHQLVGGEAASLACDPVTGLPIAQPLNVLSQQRLPIRPLINTQQFDPSQVNPLGAPGAFIGQAIDPYSPLSQVQWL